MDERGENRREFDMRRIDVPETVLGEKLLQLSL